MARHIPKDRIDELVRAATEVFIARGYRLTQMADVAEAVGVAKGTLYGYVQSKDTLLFLCLAYADQTTPISVPEDLPYKSLSGGVLSEFVKESLSREVSQPLLRAALAQPEVEDVTNEASGVVGEIFDLMARHRFGIKLLDRCSDHPELAGLWRGQGRDGTRVAVEQYVEHRIASGDFRPVNDLRVAARIVVEMCATWAVHIHWDTAPEVYDSAASRKGVIDLAVRGLLR